MKHIRLIKTIAFAAASTTIAAPIVALTSCSCEGPQSVLTRIDLELAQEELEVVEGQTKSFAAPTITCYDNNDNIIDVPTQLILKTKDDLDPPEWIKLDEDNQIVITGQQQGISTFHLTAQDVDSNITSEVKTFQVKFDAAPKVAPEYIQINKEQDLSIFFVTSTGDLQMTLRAWKDGYDEEQLSKECDWKILRSSGKQEDEKGEPLFYLQPGKEDCVLCISPNITNEYIDFYTIEIQAVNKLNPSASDTISVMIELVDGKRYVDPYQRLYTRESFDEDWALTQVPSDQTDLSNICSVIHGVPVTKIGDYFCKNSGIKGLIDLNIPSWIKTIGSWAFELQSTIKNLSMPGVEVVGYYAFGYCYNAEFIEGGEPTLTDVDTYAFIGCKKIKFTKTQRLRTVGNYAFAYTEMASMDFGNEVVSIGSYVFEYCINFTCLKISNIDPPELQASLYQSKTPLKAIVVPLNSMKKYQSATTWKFYSGIIAGN